MKKSLILTLLCVLSFTACNSKDSKIESSLTLKSSTTSNDLSDDISNEKGSFTNPYDGENETFQITCQAPHYGKESEIVLEFSNTYLCKEKNGWMIQGDVSFISGNDSIPIHINDYVTVLYYSKEGIIGYGRNTLFDSDSSNNKEFVFAKNEEGSTTSNSLLDGYIYSHIRYRPFEIEAPELGCISYFDGNEYKEVFFGKYTGYKNNTIHNNSKIKPIFTTTSSSTANRIYTDKGSITNPYDGLNESIQVTCQAPGYGKESEIVLEFTIGLIRVRAGWMIEGTIAFISGSTATPIHIDDYINVLYYNKEGIVGSNHNILMDSDSEDDEGYVFHNPLERSNSKKIFSDGYIYNFLNRDDLNGQVPKIGSVQYFDGTDYQEVFFCRYSGRIPKGIDD
ncbi:hypothetical protein [Anaerosporobacter sp.]|uniref:hypothetical protein n=1 Tax=Anaerosporobacter sp. TaxID=1872529 RepID=UPI00286ECC21|nr:hypothetical protein [Anaerosporobacter sp.]